jgi:hypothetical protein
MPVIMTATSAAPVRPSVQGLDGGLYPEEDEQEDAAEGDRRC